jgi:hypothetical protein
MPLVARVVKVARNDVIRKTLLIGIDILMKRKRHSALKIRANILLESSTRHDTTCAVNLKSEEGWPSLQSTQNAQTVRVNSAQFQKDHSCLFRKCAAPAAARMSSIR